MSSKPTKLSYITYKLLRNVRIDNKYNAWIRKVNNILDNTGFRYIWLNETCSKHWIKNTLVPRINDINNQELLSRIHNSPKCLNYRLFKTDIYLEPYLLHLPLKLSIPFCKFRLSDHTLPIEAGRHVNIDRQNRICKLCNIGIGDEYHYIFICTALTYERKLLIKPYYSTRHNSIKFKQLFSSTGKTLSNLCKFIKIIMHRCSMIT